MARGHKRSPWWSSGCCLPLPAGRARHAAQPQGPGAVDGPAEAGGEREVRTQGRRPVCGGRKRGREATGERREEELLTPPPSLGLPRRPPSLRPERCLRRVPAFVPTRDGYWARATRATCKFLAHST